MAVSRPIVPSGYFPPPKGNQAVYGDVEHVLRSIDAPLVSPLSGRAVPVRLNPSPGGLPDRAAPSPERSPQPCALRPSRDTPAAAGASSPGVATGAAPSQPPPSGASPIAAPPREDQVRCVEVAVNRQAVNSAPDLRSLFEWARSLPELYECRNCHEPVEISTEHYLRWYPYWSCFTRTQHTTYAEHLRVQREARQERAKRVAILLACCLGTAYLLVGIFLGGPL